MRMTVGVLGVALCIALPDAYAEYIDTGEPSPAEVSAWKSTLQPVADGEWFPLATWDGYSVVYVLPVDTFRSGSMVSAWTRWEFLRNDQTYWGPSHKSFSARIDF